MFFNIDPGLGAIPGECMQDSMWRKSSKIMQTFENLTWMLAETCRNQIKIVSLNLFFFACFKSNIGPPNIRLITIPSKLHKPDCIYVGSVASNQIIQQLAGLQMFVFLSSRSCILYACTARNSQTYHQNDFWQDPVQLILNPVDF